MVQKLLIEAAVLILPLFVWAFHRKFPDNKITPYLIPRNLADRKYLKSELRRAGTGCYTLAIWCFSVVFVTTDLLGRSVERIPALMAVLYFILPIVTLMSLVLGTIYLARGIFVRGDAVKPGLDSFGAAEKDRLPRYIDKIKVHNALNLLALFLLIVLIPVEASLGIGEKGWPVLLNVSLLITFILTLWRIRFYLVKAAMLMDLSANKVLASTLGNPLGVLFVWGHSVLIVRKFRVHNNGKPTF